MRGPHHSSCRGVVFLHQPKEGKRRIFPKKYIHASKIKQLLGERVETQMSRGWTCWKLQLCRCWSSLFFPPSLCGRDCRLLGCAEVCGITGLQSSSSAALPERRQSSGSLWLPHIPHTSANLVLIRPFAVTLTASFKKKIKKINIEMPRIQTSIMKRFYFEMLQFCDDCFRPLRQSAATYQQHRHVQD